jgi:hypothetical protein
MRIVVSGAVEVEPVLQVRDIIERVHGVIGWHSYSLRMRPFAASLFRPEWLLNNINDDRTDKQYSPHTHQGIEQQLLADV